MPASSVKVVGALTLAYGQDVADRAVEHYGSSEAVAARALELMREHLEKAGVMNPEEGRPLYAWLSQAVLAQILDEVSAADGTNMAPDGP